MNTTPITIPDETVRTILLAMNPVIEYPGSSQIQRARRLRTLVQTRGWEYTERRFPEVGRMRAELAVGLAAELEGQADQFDEISYHRVADLLRDRAAELRGGAQ